MRTLPLLLLLATAFRSLALPPVPTGPSPLPGATNTAVMPLLSWDSGANRLGNGGFEDGFSGWIVDGLNRGFARPRVVTNVIFPGSPPRRILPVQGIQMALFSLTDPAISRLQLEFTVPDTGHPVRLVLADRVTAGDFLLQRIPTFEGTYDVQLWEHRTTGDPPSRLTALRPPIHNRALLQDWTRWTTDITEFAGRTVRLVVSARSDNSPLQVLLDDVRLEVESPGGPEYEIRLGAKPELGVQDLLAVTHDSAVELPSLRPGSTNYWQVIARDDTGETPGPVWSFVAGEPGPPAEFAWGGPSVPVLSGQSADVAVFVQDALGNEVTWFDGDAHLLVQVATTNVPTVLFSELGNSGRDAFVEIANVGTNTMNLEGWRLTVWDLARWPEPVTTTTFPKAASLSPGRTANVRSSSAPRVGTFPNLTTSVPFYWSERPTNQLGAALLQDASGAVIDFVAVGGANPAQIEHPLRIPTGEWIGIPLAGFTTAPFFSESSETWQRAVNADTQTSADWSPQFPSPNSLNSRLTRPFTPSPAAFPVDPPVVPLTDGNWDGHLVVPFVPGPAQLVAFSTNGLVGRRAILIETNPPIRLEIPSALGEIAGTLPAGGKIRIPTAAGTDLRVNLESSSPSDLAVPESVVIPAGSAEATFDIVVIDDSLREGTVSVSVRAIASGYTTVPLDVRIDDNESATLGFILPDSAIEGNVSPTCWLTVTPSPDRDLRVFVTAGSFNTEVLVPAGADRAPFRISSPDDTTLNGTRSVTVNAFVQNWPLATGTLVITDDDRAELALTLPRALVEADQVLTNAGQIRLGGSVSTNVVVQLTSSNPRRIQAPAEIQIPAGQREATFDLTLIDNFDPEGDEVITVTGTAYGFASGTGSINTEDNDAAAFEISPIESPQSAAWPLFVAIRALNATGQTAGHFLGPLSFSVEGPGGAVPVVVESLIFSLGGLSTAVLSIDGLGSGHTIRVSDGHGHGGSSNPIELIEPPFRKIAGSVTDVVWDPGSARLYAAILGTAANGVGGRLVAFDPVNRRVTAAAERVPPVNQLVISGGGEFLYAVASTDARILQFRLPDLHLVRTWVVLAEDGNPAPVVDLAVQPGHPEVVVVARAQVNASPSANGIAVYDQGAKRAKVLDAFTQRVNRIEFNPTGEILYGYENETTANAFARMRVDDTGVSLIQVDAFTTGSFFLMDFALHGDAVVFGDGQVYFPTTGANRKLEFGGAQLAIATEESRQRVYGAEGSGLDTRIRAFDFVSGRETDEVLLPGLYSQFGGVSRLVRWGDNGFAAVVGGTLAYCRSDSIPSSNPVDLALTLPSGPPTLIARQPATLELKVRNPLPGAAPGVELLLPWALLPIQDLSVRVGGELVPLQSRGNDRIARIGDLPAGGEFEVEVQFTPSFGGPLPLSGFVTAHAPEDIRDNNAFSLDLYAGTQIARSGDAILKLSVDSLIGSAHRPLLYIGQGSEHRVVELDPSTGRLGRALPVELPSPLDLLALSQDARRLYVASTEGFHAVEIDTESMTVVRRFALGSDANPEKPAHLMVRPASAETLAVLTGSASGQGGVTRGLSLFDAGVLIASQNAVVSSIAFSTDGQLIYGINAGRDPIGQRWRVSAEGLQDLGSFSRWVGTSISRVEVSDGVVNLSGILCRDDADLTPLGRLPNNILGFPSVFAPEVGRLLTIPLGSPLLVIDLHRSTFLAGVPLPDFDLDMKRNLVRWGSDGLAWKMRSESITLMRTDWLASETAEADLSVELETPGQPESPGGPIPVQVTVRNHGPRAATRVLLNLNTAYDLQIRRDGELLPSPAPDRSDLDLSLGDLAPGAEARLTLSLTRDDPRLTVPLGLVVRSDATDRNSSNQMAVAFLNWTPPGSFPQWVGPGSSLRQALWDPRARRFYLTIDATAGRTGNSLVSFDPVTGRFGRPLFPGSLPNRLALAEDGSRLYVALDGTSEVAVCDLPSLTISQRFPLGLSLNGVYLRTARDSFVVPGQPSQYVASLVTGLSELTLPADGTALYRDGIKAPIEVPGSMATHIAPAPDPGVLFGADSQSQPPAALLRIEITPNGMEGVQQRGRFAGSPGDFVVSGNWLIGEDGSTVSTLTGDWKLLEGFAAPRSLVCVEPDGSRVFTVSQTSAQMLVYRVGESAPTQPWDTGIGSQLAFGSFQRWGVDGFALGTHHGLWLFRAPIVEPDATADWDGDGLPDAWEHVYGTDPHAPDAGADPDGDGSTNLTEWAAGTSPYDATSRFELRLTRGEGGTWSGQFQSLAGRHYQVQSSANLEGPWVPVGDNVAGADTSVTVALPSASDTQWFRVTISAP